MSVLVPIILCGGVGKRLWPLSTQERPKQFTEFLDGKSLTEITIQRVKSITKIDPIFVTSFKYKYFINNIIKKFSLTENVIYEEVGKNTTASIYFASMLAEQNYRNPNLLILPSDHFIQNNSTFSEIIKNSSKYISNFSWIVYGVKPKTPSPDYGYISTIKTNKLYEVKEFIEKPNTIKAKKLIKQDHIFWNSGIFMSSSKRILSSVKTKTREKFKPLSDTWNKKNALNNTIVLPKKQMLEIKTSSIDYDVLEKEQNIGLFELNVGWSDIGTWDGFSATLEETKTSKIIKNNSKRTFVFSPKRTTVLLGVKDIIVSNYNNSTLIAAREHSSSIKKVFDKIEKNKLNEIEKDKEENPNFLIANEFIRKNINFKKLEINKNKIITIKSNDNQFYVISGEVSVIFSEAIQNFTQGKFFSTPKNKEVQVKNISKTKSELIEIIYND